MYQNIGTPMGEIPVRKRRSRKKKEEVLDPEAERQERELRMKIKQSLHTQQDLRTKVEEEEKAQQRSLNISNVVNKNANMAGKGVRGGGSPAASSPAPTVNNQMNDFGMMATGMDSEIQRQYQQQWQRQQQQQQYQFNAQNQQYVGNNIGVLQQIGGGSGISNEMQQRIQQMKQQLELQAKELEQQLKLKQHLELEQQKIRQAQQIQLRQQQQQQQLPPKANESPAFFLGGESQFSSEDIMRSLKYKQERLMEEARRGGFLNNTTNNIGGQELSQMPHYAQNSIYRPSSASPNSTGSRVDLKVSPTIPSSPQCVQTPHQQDQSGGQHLNRPLGPSMIRGDKLSSNQAQLNPSYSHNCVGQQCPSNSFRSYQQGSQQSVGQNALGINYGDNNEGELSSGGAQYDLSQNVESQAIHQQKYQPHLIRKQVGPCFKERDDGQLNLPLNSLNKQQGPNPSDQQTIAQPADNQLGQKSHLAQRPLGHRSSQETYDKSLLSDNSMVESWNFGSAAFNSVGNMSASFSGSFAGDMADAPINSSVQRNLPAREVGGDEDINPNSKGTKDGSIDSTPVVVSRESSQSTDREVGSTSINVGTTYTETYTETSIALQPIQENEADDSSHKKNTKSFGESNSGGDTNSISIKDLMMSLDSTTFEALMKQSQDGENMNFSMVDLGNSMASNSLGTGAANTGKPLESSDSSKSSLSISAADVSDGKHVKSSSSSESMQLQDSNQSNQSPDNPRNNFSSARSRGSARSHRSRRDSNENQLSMMSEISQWTQNNPFEDAADSGSDKTLKQQNQQQKPKQLQKEGSVLKDSYPGDMGDFHSVGGSVCNSLDISMMSSMTPGGEELSMSVKGLEISGRSVENRGIR